MRVKITFPDLTPQDWVARLSKISRSTLLQSYAYAQAIRVSQNLNTRWAVLLIDGEEAGIAQIHEASILGKLFHVVTLDRGPLWFKGYGKPKDWEDFSKSLNKLYPKRFGRSRRFIPETDNTHLELTDFIKKDLPHYQTIWLDLTAPLEGIRKNLKQKWRNALNKAEKQNITVEIDEYGQFISWMIKRYIDDRIEKKYPGPSPKFLATLLSFCAKEETLLIFKASIKGEEIAGITVLMHGTSATYQIGWANDEGRKNNAMNLLLWQAITTLKSKGITEFDLGGINDQAPGLVKFKEGLNGKKISYIGHFS